MRRSSAFPRSGVEPTAGLRIELLTRGSGRCRPSNAVGHSRDALLDCAPHDESTTSSSEPPRWSGFSSDVASPGSFCAIGAIASAKVANRTATCRSPLSPKPRHGAGEKLPHPATGNEMAETVQAAREIQTLRREQARIALWKRNWPRNGRRGGETRAARRGAVAVFRHLQGALGRGAAAQQHLVSGAGQIDPGKNAGRRAGDLEKRRRRSMRWSSRCANRSKKWTRKSTNWRRRAPAPTKRSPPRCAPWPSRKTICAPRRATWCALCVRQSCAGVGAKSNCAASSSWRGWSIIATSSSRPPCRRRKGDCGPT